MPSLWALPTRARRARAFARHQSKPTLRANRQYPIVSITDQRRARLAAAAKARDTNPLKASVASAALFGLSTQTVGSTRPYKSTKTRKQPKLSTSCRSRTCFSSISGSPNRRFRSNRSKSQKAKFSIFSTTFAPCAAGLSEAISISARTVRANLDRDPLLVILSVPLCRPMLPVHLEPQEDTQTGFRLHRSVSAGWPPRPSLIACCITVRSSRSGATAIGCATCTAAAFCRRPLLPPRS